MQEILDGILEAIEDEIRAQRHYQMLADRSNDPKAKKFFEQLVIEEKKHEEILRSRYEALIKIEKAKEE